MRVHLGADHAGFELKTHLISWLTEHGYEPVDHGAHEYDAEDDYPPFGVAAAQEAAEEPGARGIVSGGSGHGEEIGANKVKGIRCALTWSVETAQLARQHNNAQVMGIGARMHSVEDAEQIVEAFLTTQWSQADRHQRRIDLLAGYEQTGSF